jgi:hypothetical protein
MDDVAIYRHRQIGWAMLLSAIVPLTILFVFGHLATPDSQASRALGAARPIFLLALLLPLSAVVLFSSLEVSVDRRALKLRFGPFGPIRKSWPLDAIASASVTRTTLSQGWGIRVRRGFTLYNVSGFGAVRVEFKDGKTVLVGSDEPDKLARAITRIQSERR